MNKLKDGYFIGYDTRIFIVQLLVNIQIFPLVGGNSSSTRPAYKREYLYICFAQSENLDNSEIALPKVRIPKLADRVGILTLHGTIPELSMRKVRIRTK